jgi:UDP-glucuronate 4-epimerase
MAPIMFAEKIRKQQTVHLFAEGKLKRDFTYIGDTVFAISRLIELQISKGRRDIVNIGHSNPIQVLDFLSTLAGSLNMAPKIEFAPMQISDVPLTCANDQKLQEWIGPWPETPIATGLNDMVQWLTKWEVT